MKESPNKRSPAFSVQEGTPVADTSYRLRKPSPKVEIKKKEKEAKKEAELLKSKKPKVAKIQGNLFYL